jgi:hypothetical protein
MRFSTLQADAMGEGPEQLVIELERLVADKDALRRQQAAQIIQLEQQLSERNAKLGELERILRWTHESRSWRLTAPLRKIKDWLF